MKNDIKTTLVTKEELEQRVKAIGAQITEDYRGKELVLVGVLKGAFMFLGDLARSIEIPLEVDFMAVSSYGHSTVSSGVV